MPDRPVVRRMTANTHTHFHSGNDMKGTLHYTDALTWDPAHVGGCFSVPPVVEQFSPTGQHGETRRANVVRATGPLADPAHPHAGHYGHRASLEYSCLCQMSLPSEAPDSPLQPSTFNATASTGARMFGPHVVLKGHTRLTQTNVGQLSSSGSHALADQSGHSPHCQAHGHESTPTSDAESVLGDTMGDERGGSPTPTTSLFGPYHQHTLRASFNTPPPPSPPARLGSAFPVQIASRAVLWQPVAGAVSPPSRQVSADPLDASVDDGCDEAGVPVTTELSGRSTLPRVPTCGVPIAVLPALLPLESDPELRLSTASPGPSGRREATQSPPLMLRPISAVIDELPLLPGGGSGPRVITAGTRDGSAHPRASPGGHENYQRPCDSKGQPERGVDDGASTRC